LQVFNIGLKAIRRFCEEQKPLSWYNAKLSVVLFKGEQEQTVFKWVEQHMLKHHALPNIETLEGKFPEFKQFTTPEPSSYYIELIEQRYGYDVINAANISSQDALKSDKTAINDALAFLSDARDKITRQRYRTRILNLGKEGPKLVLQQYHNVLATDSNIDFGWPYLDTMTGGAMAGDVISFVGRPAAGKTFKMLASAMHNWLKKKRILFVSMEMNPLAIAQRATAMYAHTNLTQLKMGQYSTDTYKKFAGSLISMAGLDFEFYVVDGNLAASVEDIYTIADQLNCDAVYIDGAYLLKHKNPRIDRYTKVAENVEGMKQFSGNIEKPTFASWQFNRDASKKTKGEKTGLEDIAYSDAIGQVSSIVLGLFQEEGVETMNSRVVDVLKGRNGEIGQFKIKWDFINMDFTQIGAPGAGDEPQPLGWL
jgi:replicative DNA helicase